MVSCWKKIITKKKKRTLHTESNMQYIFPIKIKYEIQLVNWLSTCVTFDTDDWSGSTASYYLSIPCHEAESQQLRICRNVMAGSVVETTHKFWNLCDGDSYTYTTSASKITKLEILTLIHLFYFPHVLTNFWIIRGKLRVLDLEWEWCGGLFGKFTM